MKTVSIFNTLLIVFYMMNLSDLHANTYVVTQTSGTGADTLYDAINQANAHAGADIIDLRNVSGKILLFSELPAITGNTEILANGALTIDGRNTFRIFHIDADSAPSTISVEVNSLIFENGLASGGATGRSEWGGAIMGEYDLNLTLRNCVFRNNASVNQGGAVTAYCNALLIENCTFIGNTSSSGGAVSGFTQMTFRNATFTENHATFSGTTGTFDGYGGAVILFGSGSSASFTHCTIVNNLADKRGGGIFLSDSTSASFSYSVITDNLSNGQTSGIDIENFSVTLSYPGQNFFVGDPKLGPLGFYHHAFLPTFNLLPGSPLLDAANGSTQLFDQRGKSRPQNGTPDIGAFEAKTYLVAFNLPDTGAGSLREGLLSDADIIDMRLTGGSYTPSTLLPDSDGVVIIGSGADKLSIGSPSDAPVFHLNKGGPLILMNLRIGPSVSTDPLNSHRTGVFVDGTIFWAIDCRFGECTSYEGGSALTAFDSSIKILRCCFDNNTSWQQSGGALALVDCSAVIENSTFSGNQARQGSLADGGALSFSKSAISTHPSTLILNHCTFYGNHADHNGGHLSIANTVDSAIMKNTLLTGGTANGSDPAISDPGAILVSDSNFLTSSAAGVIDTTLRLNGGTTYSHMPLPDSLIVDAARASGSPKLDQRGVVRSGEGPAPDIGAIELQTGKYRRWLAKYFSASNVPSGNAFSSAPIHLQDFDGDGVSNIAEFLFRMNPTVKDSELSPWFIKDVETFFTYGGIGFRENIDAPGEVSYFPERSIDMVHWASAGMSRDQNEIIHPGYTEVAYYSSNNMGAAPSGTPKEFYRIRVQPPVDQIELAYVRDPGNSSDPSTGRGAVTNIFRISTHEVTNSEYTRFLNTVDTSGFDFLDLYNSEQASNPASGITFDSNATAGHHYSVKSGFENLPVVLVDYWDAVRYANWRHNGAGTGSDTESGAYTLDGGSPIPSNASNIMGRNAGARFFLPNADEWYKAAYYQGGSVYSLYPTGQNTVSNSGPPGGIDSANYSGASVRPVGSYTQARNNYLLYDMGGNVDEMIEKSSIGNSIIYMGGAYDSGATQLHSSNWDTQSGNPSVRYINTGFRIAAAKE